MSIEQNPMNVEILENESDQTWLVLKIQEQHYAVNCRDVLSIFIADFDVTEVSGYSSDVKGVFDFRGSVIPLLELRSVLGKISFEAEHQQFTYDMDMRKSEHMAWVSELARCTYSGEKFTLATDPHQCAFGKWYDSYKPSNQAVAFDMKKIEDPHRLLHEAAIRIAECGNDEEKKMEYLRKVEQEYAPKVVALLDDLKDVYRTGFREMCVVLSNDEGKMIGTLVDEVLSVGALRSVDSQNMFDNSCVHHVARSESVKGEIFVLDRDVLFSTVFRQW